ncbi:hypothetical protein KR026_004038, partial [Drosophila bipectinata]
RMRGVMESPLVQSPVEKFRKVWVRTYMPVAGPPRFPMSAGQRLIFGWGSLLLMMVIPFWALYSTPRWSKLHNGIPLDEDKPPPEEPEDKEDK